MRTPSAKSEADLAAPIQTPIVLIELGFSVPMRLSTGDTVPWGGYSWVASAVRDPRIRKQANGVVTGSLSLPNLDSSGSALALGEGVNGKTCKIWETRGEPPYANEDVLMLFSGIINGAVNRDDFVDINLLGRGASVLYAPNVRIGKPVFNHLPVPGTIITVGAERFELSTRR